MYQYWAEGMWNGTGAAVFCHTVPEGLSRSYIEGIKDLGAHAPRSSRLHPQTFADFGCRLHCESKHYAGCYSPAWLQ